MAILRFEALRPDDLVYLEFETHNLRLDTADVTHPRLVVDDHKAPAYLVVRFPPQAIAEQAYFQTAPNITRPPPQPLPGASDPLDPPGLWRRMAGTSRLVFRLPHGIREIPYRLDALLDWTALEPVLSPTALGVDRPAPIAPPAALETAIEIPYRLTLAPATHRVGWLHARVPETHAGRISLWHTRLASARPAPHGGPRLLEAGERNTVPLRATWSPDFHDHAPLQGANDLGPARAAMAPRDRAQIVVLTSGTEGYFVPSAGGGAAPWTPEPVKAARIFLSALGGWLTAHGRWPSLPSYVADDGTTQSLDLSEWRHLATQGRDHYVRIVYEGFLFPFGHRAALVKVTERKVASPNGGAVTSPTAYLRQHMYVVVREREKTYSRSTYVHDGREMPFLKSVRIETRVTPDIDDPQYLENGTPNRVSFWIDVGGAGFPFHIRARDLADAPVDFTAPLIFMDVAEASVEAIRTAYANGGARRACRVNGRKVAYADPAAGDTTLRTSALFFDAQTLQPGPPYPAAPFVPTLEHASVSVLALEHLLGTTTPVDIQLYDRYLGSGVDAFAGVFARIVGTPPTVGFTADKAGGFATPNFALTALSARKGLVAGSPDDAAAGVIDPEQFFGGVAVPGRIFGTIPLASLIPVVNKKADATRNAPEIRSRVLPSLRHPERVVTRIRWQPEAEDYSEGPVTLVFDQDGPSRLTLHTTIERSLTAAAGGSLQVGGELTNFFIDLLGVVKVRVVSIVFRSRNGEKPSVKATLPERHPVTFEGPLAFVQTLAEVLPPGIFGGRGPSIDLLRDRLRVGYTLGLPPISIGVFALEHISISTALDLPYVDGKPGFEFGFAKRNAPFLITVECFGGGGFVHLLLTADGVEMVEGALEFGGLFSLDLGVASGGVHVMAGIYFKLKSTSSDLTGFVDIGGEVSVLGIVSISIDLNLSLSYQTSNGKEMVQGRATLTVSVHVLFFSASVQLSVEKSYGKGPGDPRVHQLMSADDWSAYAEAFA